MHYVCRVFGIFATDRTDIELSLAKNLLAQSLPERAETYARKAYDREPGIEGHFDLLSSIYTTLNNDSELTIITRQMAKICRERGDEERARELMQRIAGDDTFDAAETELSATPDDLQGDFQDDQDDDDLLDDDFLDDDFLAVGDDDDDNLLDESDDFLAASSDDDE